MTIWILGASLTVQCVAALWSLRLNVVTGRKLAWMAISVALSLMAVRRGISMWGHLSGTNTRELNSKAEAVALVISSLMLLGVILIGPLFRSIVTDREIHKRRRLRDDLTGLANRAALEESLDEAVAKTEATGNLLGVVFIDIDRFKVVNDSLGHSQGDEILKVVGKRIERACRESDLVARWGGDEFVIVLSDLSGQEEAEALSDRLRETLSEPVSLDGRTLSVTASVGIVLSRGGDDGQALLRDADLAMYKAKEAGPSQRIVFEPEMREILVARIKLERELAYAIRNDELRIHYQPIYAGDDMRIDGVEALLRWQHPESGLLTPDRFLPLAESSGLMPAIDNWVLRTCLRRVAEWKERDDELSGVRVMVNSSPSNFTDPSYPERVRAMLEESGVAANRLVLELLETAVIEKPSIAHRVISELRELGISVYLDDFGTGYSSLSYLTKLYVDGIKIDGSFVNGSANDPQLRAIIMSIVAMAEAMMIPVVAEGIERDADLEVVRGAGATLFQGFALCTPRPHDELEAVLVGQ